MEALYRNDGHDVAGFLQRFHGDHCWTFNLCSERAYDPVCACA
jgi:hypothetical protein